MYPSRPLGRFALVLCLGMGLAVGVPGELRAKEPVPQTTAEGLQLQKSQAARLVYLKPGATFKQYDRVAILKTLVEFSKDWQRDYNANATGLQGRVTTRDMERMKANVAAAFEKVFAEELQKNGGYDVVDQAGPGVLVLRPAIINLQVTAPDLSRSDVRTTLVRSAGAMTLYLELWDGATNTILARIMDPQEDESFGNTARRADRINNKAAMEDILRDWARKLRKHLDAARGR